MIKIIWEFDVKPFKNAVFEKAYGKGGQWAGLFCKSKEYHGTFLLLDKAIPNRYITIDQWSDINAFNRFLVQYAKDYEALDHKCAEMTLSEKKIGVFEET